MAVPSFIGTEKVDQASALEITVPIPASAQAGDFMVCFVKQSENTTQRIWDDDGGGGNGWIQGAYNRTTGGRDMETSIYYKFNNGSENNPTFKWANAGTTPEPMGGIMVVYRGVDSLIPISQLNFKSGQNDANPPNPSIEISYENTRVAVFHGATHDDITSVAAPTGYTLRNQIWNGTSDDHRNMFAADAEVDTIGTYTPPDWGHSVANTVPEYHTYTIGLNEAQPIHILGGTYDQFNWGDTGIIITGDGFENIQGSGKVELWSDRLGTIKQVQTIVSWSELSITFDTVQGSLQDNTTVYLVITNDSGDQSSSDSASVGLIPYNQVRLSLKPDHNWNNNGNGDDDGITGPIRNMTNAIVGSPTFDNMELAEGLSQSLRFTSVTQRKEILDSPNMNISINSKERTIDMWFMVGGIQQSLSTLWKEGGGVQNLAFLMGMGNKFVYQLADIASSRDNVQVYSDILLTPNRPYHAVLRYTHLQTVKECTGWLDGRRQTVSDGNPMVLGIFDTHSGDVVWNDSDNNLEMGAVDISFDGQESGWIGPFGTWSDNSADGGFISDDDILQKLFRRGAVPKYNIEEDTVVNMQADLASQLNNIEVPDWPLGVRINTASDASNIELTLDGTTFNSRVSDHLEWRGTGQLTIVLTNGAELDLSKTFSPNGGTIVIIETVLTTITGIPAGAEWRLYLKNPTVGIIGNVELAGEEVKPNGDDIVYSDRWKNDQDIGLQVMISGKEEYLIYSTLTADDQTIIVELKEDIN